MLKMGPVLAERQLAAALVPRPCGEEGERQAQRSGGKCDDLPVMTSSRL